MYGVARGSFGPIGWVVPSGRVAMNSPTATTTTAMSNVAICRPLNGPTRPWRSVTQMPVKPNQVDMMNSQSISIATPTAMTSAPPRIETA